MGAWQEEGWEVKTDFSLPATTRATSEESSCQACKTHAISALFINQPRSKVDDNRGPLTVSPVVQAMLQWFDLTAAAIYTHPHKRVQSLLHTKITKAAFPLLSGNLSASHSRHDNISFTLSNKAHHQRAPLDLFWLFGTHLEPIRLFLSVSPALAFQR